MPWLGTVLAQPHGVPQADAAPATDWTGEPIALALARSINIPLAPDQVRSKEVGDPSPTHGWAAVGRNDLQDWRGGFDAGPGLTISFGIERSVSLNGNLVTTTSLNVPDIARMGSGQAGAGSTAATMNLIQNGAGNIFQAAQLSPSAAATVIQNSLNEQKIQSLTVINATANSLSLLKSFNAQTALKDALANSIGVR